MELNMIKIFFCLTVCESAENLQISASMIAEQPVANPVVRKSFRTGLLSLWLTLELIIVSEKVKAERHVFSS